MVESGLLRKSGNTDGWDIGPGLQGFLGDQMSPRESLASLCPAPSCYCSHFLHPCSVWTCVVGRASTQLMLGRPFSKCRQRVSLSPAYLVIHNRVSGKIEVPAPLSWHFLVPPNAIPCKGAGDWKGRLCPHSLVTNLLCVCFS